MSDTPRTDKRCLESQSLKSMSMRFAWMCDFARELERENAALRKDKQRLDWMDSCANYQIEGNLLRWSFFTPSSMDDIRAAIDAARKEAQP